MGIHLFRFFFFLNQVKYMIWLILISKLHLFWQVFKKPTCICHIFEWQMGKRSINFGKIFYYIKEILVKCFNFFKYIIYELILSTCIWIIRFIDVLLNCTVHVYFIVSLCSTLMPLFDEDTNMLFLVGKVRLLDNYWNNFFVCSTHSQTVKGTHIPHHVNIHRAFH